MNGGVGVELGDQREQFGLGGSGRQLVGEAGHAGFFAGFPFVADVELAGLVGADQDGGQARPHAALPQQVGHSGSYFGLDDLGQMLTIKDRRGHCSLFLAFARRRLG